MRRVGTTPDSLLAVMEKDNNWNRADLLPEGFQPLAMTIDVKTPGEFAQKYLEATGTDIGGQHRAPDCRGVSF